MEYKLFAYGTYSRINMEGAFSFFLVCDDIEVKGFVKRIKKETTNRAEIKAIIAGLYHLPQDAESVTVYSDSEYALNTLFGHWNRYSNKDLFEAFEKMMDGRKLHIEWHWLKGHNGNYYSSVCYQLVFDELGYELSKDYEV